MDETRARFLAAIAQRLGSDRIVELHLFSPIRQGALETGVAVVAAVQQEHAMPESEMPPAAVSDASPPAVESDASRPATDNDRDRLEVLTARYRLTRKGPDRGKWLFEIAATADAPLATVDAVARGVTLRSKDLTESERFSGEQLRELLDSPAGRAPA